ncbi:MAG: aminopeptidase P family protein [Muribaculum sp.]|nr:aminopeptidase P family protein [Muribaculum sp.]
MKTDIKSRLEALRAEMNRAGVDLAVIPHADPHQSEYMSSHWHLRGFFSGFTGSAGTLVVGKEEACLWTDSRYFLQAAQQLEGTGIKLMKEGIPGTPEISEYIINSLPAGATVGIDGMQFSINAENSLRKELNAHDIKLDTTFRPADAIWTDRPALPANKAFIHELKYSGEATTDKISKILNAINQKGADSILVSALDELAWTLNLRGSDVKYNPVVTAFLYLGKENSTLFIDEIKLDDKTNAYLTANGISTAPYDGVATFLSRLPETEKVLVDPASTSSAMANPLGNRMVTEKSPIPLMKGVKNEVQIAGIHAAMKRDGVALVRAMMDIEQMLSEGKTLTEMEVGRILTRRRSEQPLYFDDSFGTIAGYRGHGAIVHYEATPESDSTIEPDGLLLIDSGAQYLDGTTDITRTIALGSPTEDERHDFTLVMKGHIALGSAIFPEGTRGSQLDALARHFLWNEGKSYLHGTGHGVGHFLNVHEGPQNIRLNENPATLVPGMLTSNEPGLYITDKYGIRCENLILTVPAFTTEFGNFYKFETVTLFPFDIKLFDVNIMTEEEICWLNAYHKRVYDTLSPELNKQECAWLEKKTIPLTKDNQ